MFIHDAVLESLICGTTQINAADLKSAIAELGEKDEQSGKNGFETQFNVRIFVVVLFYTRADEVYSVCAVVIHHRRGIY